MDQIPPPTPEDLAIDLEKAYRAFTSINDHNKVAGILRLFAAARRNVERGDAMGQIQISTQNDLKVPRWGHAGALCRIEELEAELAASRRDVATLREALKSILLHSSVSRVNEIAAAALASTAPTTEDRTNG